MAVCDGDKARMYAVDNAGTGTTAEQFAYMWAAWALLGPLNVWREGLVVSASAVANATVSPAWLSQARWHSLEGPHGCKGGQTLRH